MDFVAFVETAIAAYLLGSIPTGYHVAKAKSIDIRTVGSGNIGATNVMRILGKPAGISVLFIDAVKGWLAVWWLAKLAGDYLLPPNSSRGSYEIVAIVAALCAILGHNYTCWLKFKGGKGIATSAGVLLALVPLALIIVLSIWFVLFALTRFVSVGSIGAAAALPFATWLTTQRPLLTVVTAAVGALAIYKHKPNIQRLLNGTENRVGAKTNPNPAPTNPPAT